jgi:hypothetical protein
MHLATLAVLGALDALWPFGHGQSQTAQQQFRLPTWEVATYRDRFTGEVRCKLYQGRLQHPDVTYAAKTVAFHFRTTLNTTEAAYRLDGGEVRAWRAEYPKLIRLGVQLDGDNLENPTGGLVILPIEDLKAVHTITIRATPRTTPRTFGVDGLADAIASASTHGCNPDASFVH